MGRLAGVLFAVVLMFFLSGCSKKRPPPPQMFFHVQSDTVTNNGQLFYFVSRNITDKQFLTDDYQMVANMVFADPPEKTIIRSHVILPGTKQQLQIEQPEENPLALYFFFTEPGDQWKRLLDQPLAKDYDIKIEKNTVTISKRKSLWRRIFWPF